MNKILFILIILFNINTTFCNELIHVIFFEYRNEASIPLRMGFVSNSSDYYDISLEQDVPPLPPPDAVIPVFEIMDTSKNEMKYSQIEYKESSDGQFVKTYMVRLLGNAQVDFGLSVKGLPLGVDSIIVKDKINGNLFRWIVSSPKDTTMLRFYSQFAIDVYYNSDKINSIEENNKDSELENYLNSKLTISNNELINYDSEIKILNVTNILGMELVDNKEMNKGDNFKLKENINSTNNSIFIYIEYKNKRHLIKKIAQ